MLSKFHSKFQKMVMVKGNSRHRTFQFGQMFCEILVPMAPNVSLDSKFRRPPHDTFSIWTGSLWSSWNFEYWPKSAGSSSLCPHFRRAEAHCVLYRISSSKTMALMLLVNNLIRIQSKTEKKYWKQFIRIFRFKSKIMSKSQKEKTTTKQNIYKQKKIRCLYQLNM